MTDEAVTESVVNKAHANGYKFSWDSINHMNLDVLVPQVIFDFSFAKALWGEEEYVVCEYVSDLNGNSNGNSKLPYKSASHEGVYIPCYQYHLQQLVLAENRIEYLKQFVD